MQQDVLGVSTVYSNAIWSNCVLSITETHLYIPIFVCSIGRKTYIRNERGKYLRYITKTRTVKNIYTAFAALFTTGFARTGD